LKFQAKTSGFEERAFLDLVEDVLGIHVQALILAPKERVFQTPGLESRLAP
jgi:hypothetical protein